MPRVARRAPISRVSATDEVEVSTTHWLALSRWGSQVSPSPGRPRGRRAATAGSGRTARRSRRAVRGADTPGRRGVPAAPGAGRGAENGTREAAGEVAAHRLAHHPEADEPEPGNRPQDAMMVPWTCPASSGCRRWSATAPGRGIGKGSCIASVRGTRIYFDVEGMGLVPDGPGDAERPVAMVIHGGPGGDHSGFKPGFTPLAARMQLVYFDHRGQGRSAAGRSRDLHARRERRGHGGAAAPPGAGADRRRSARRMAGWWRWRMPRATPTRCRTWS